MEHIERAAEKRRLRIYATDPMSGRRAPFRIAIDIDNEPDLKRGPRGEIIEIWDYDVDNDQYYRAVNLNDPALLMEAGLAPSESDPRFHQQMVYAVTMKVIESARRALGRPVTFYGGRSKPRLRLLPMPSTARTRSSTPSSMRSCSDISAPTRARRVRTCRARPCSPACRTTSSRMR